jgi:hypothetical protein
MITSNEAVAKWNWATKGLNDEFVGPLKLMAPPGDSFMMGVFQRRNVEGFGFWVCAAASMLAVFDLVDKNNCGFSSRAELVNVLSSSRWLQTMVSVLEPQLGDEDFQRCICVTGSPDKTANIATVSSQAIHIGFNITRLLNVHALAVFRFINSEQLKKVKDPTVSRPSARGGGGGAAAAALSQNPEISEALGRLRTLLVNAGGVFPPTKALQSAIEKIILGDPKSPAAGIVSVGALDFDIVLGQSKVNGKRLSTFFRGEFRACRLAIAAFVGDIAAKEAKSFAEKCKSNLEAAGISEAEMKTLQLPYFCFHHMYAANRKMADLDVLVYVCPNISNPEV